MSLVTIARTGATFPTIHDAVQASQAGDTLEVQGGIGPDAVVYNERAINIDWDLTFKVIGDPGSVLVRPFDAVNNVWRAVAKGLFNIGQAGTFPTVEFDGFHITRCSGGLNTTGTVKGAAWGLVINPGEPLQTGDGNGAGVRYQSGNLTMRNGLIDFCQDGVLAQPFRWGTGKILLDGMTIRNCGTGGGQAHIVYGGRIELLTVNNCIFDHALAGQNLKSRAKSTVLTGTNVFGSTDAGDRSNNQMQIIEGSVLNTGTLTLNKGPKSTNPFIVEIGGVVPMFASTVVNLANLIVNDKFGAAAIVWNFFPIPIAISGMTITSVKPTAPIINGLGTFTGVTFNGAPIPDGVGTPCQALGNLAGVKMVDLSQTTGPQTVTLASNQSVIGGPGQVSATSAANMTDCQIITGTGGANISVTGAGVSFASHPGDAPSTVYVASPQNIFANADGDTVTVDRNAGAYVSVSARNVTINSFEGSAGTIEMKQAYPGIVPSGTVVQRGGSGEAIFIDNGGTFTITGTTVSAQYDAMSSGDDAPATFIFDNTWLGVNYTGTFTGGAFVVAQSGTAPPDVISYSDPFSHNLYQPGAGSWNFPDLINDTLDLGASVGVSAITSGASYLTGIGFAVIAGSGEATVNINGPGVVQAIGDHNPGGTVILDNYNATHAAQVQIALLDVTAAPAVHKGSTWTLALSNGTTFEFPGGVAPNLTPPAAANDLTVSAPATLSARPGVPINPALGFASAYADANTGFVKARVTTSDRLWRFIGRPADVLAQLAAAEFTFVGDDTLVLDVWNQAGVHASASVAVSAAPVMITFTPPPITVDVPPVTGAPGSTVQPPPITVTPPPVVLPAG